MDKGVDIRWKQRLTNYVKAVKLLSEVDDFPATTTPPIIREGFVQRFEVAFDLAWKTLRDYLDFQGITVQPTPRAVIKAAFAAGVIKDGQIFIDMLEARNLLSHTYDEEVFLGAFDDIQQSYRRALAELATFLAEAEK